MSKKKKEEIRISPAALGAMLDGDFHNARVAMMPGGIEAQERAGQATFCATETLPTDSPWDDLELLGITKGKKIDDIFVEAKLPAGWKKKSTEHAMWSHLLDNKGRRRAGIFYKAAFYDRSARLSLDRRFSFTCEPKDGYDRDIPYKDRDAGKWIGVVKDSDKIIYRTIPMQGPTYEQRDELSEKAQAWLKKKYPDYESVLAYWK